MKGAVVGLMWSVALAAGPARAWHGMKNPAARPSLAQVAAQQPAPQPASSPRVEVLVIEAGAGDAGVAVALRSIPQLRQPPFNTFTQMRLVSRALLPLATAPATAPLPNGGSASVSLASRSPEGRYTVNVSFSGAGNIQFVAGAGEPFFTVRSSRPDRALIIGFIVRG